MELLKLTEKYGPWATITGASSGIGRALTLVLAKEGFNVHVIGRNNQSLKKLSQQVSEQHQRQSRVTIGDLSTETGTNHVIEDAHTLEVGFFIHAAGAESHGPITESDIEDELRLLNLNIHSTFKLTHHFANKFVKQGKGGILMVSSLTGHFISPYFANYASSKSYILSLGNSLRHELKSKGVDVSVLSPGLTETPMSKNIGKDIDWSKTPMKTSTAEFVAQYTLKHFPLKANIIPGKNNQISAFIGKRLFPQFFGKQNEAMIRKAIKPQHSS